MSAPHCESCREYTQREQAAYSCPEYATLSRRGFLATTGAVSLAAMSPAWLPRVALAKSYRSSQRDVIVQIYLRGGSDGLTMCVPWGDPGYYTSRPNLAVPRPDSGLTNAATNLDGFFGIPPAMLPLLPAYQNGHLLFVHACGLNDPTRSHFDAQRFMEVGKANDLLLNTGWLGRHLATVAPATPGALLRGVGIGSGLAKTLDGGPLTLPIPDLDTFNLSGSSSTLGARRGALSDMYNSTTDPLKTIATNTFATIDLLNTINFSGYVPAGGAVYPTGSFGYAMKTTAALIKAQVGVEAVAIDLGGWDTHNSQGVSIGTMANLMTTLASAMGAFYTDMFTGTNPSVVAVVMSEFGRRVAENGSQGTDHGHGNAMLVLGNAVSGGRVLRTWPGLGPGQLYQNLDLNITIDYRDVLAEILQNRLGNASLSTVFPQYTPVFRGVLS